MLDQIAQIENLISRGVDVLVIVPYNATVLNNAISEAKKAKIKVVSSFFLSLQSTKIVTELERFGSNIFKSKLAVAFIKFTFAKSEATVIFQKILFHSLMIISFISCSKTPN